MARGKLFEYAILHHPTPTKDENDRGVTPKSTIVVPPTAILATSNVQAGQLAARAIPDAHVDHIDELEIRVVDF